MRIDREAQQRPNAAPLLLTPDAARQMRILFDGVVAEPLPDRLTALLRQLDRSDGPAA